MSNESNASYPQQTHACIPASEIGRATIETILRNRWNPNQPQPMCWNCLFFEPSDPNWDLDQPPDDECLHGECHFGPPVTDHGKRDASCNYADFPIVMASDWCGKLVPRQPLPFVETQGVYGAKPDLNHQPSRQS
jgi:hypothetical protein